MQCGDGAVERRFVAAAAGNSISDVGRRGRVVKLYPFGGSGGVEHHVRKTKDRERKGTKHTERDGQKEDREREREDGN